MYTILSNMCQEGEKARDRDGVPFLDALAGCDVVNSDSEAIFQQPDMHDIVAADIATRIESIP